MRAWRVCHGDACLTCVPLCTELHVVRAHCEIEFTLDECVRRMRAALVIETVKSATSTALKQEKMLTYVLVLLLFLFCFFSSFLL